jgi:hypothetical protein
VLGKFSDKAQLHKDDMHLYLRAISERGKKDQCIPSLLFSHLA